MQRPIKTKIHIAYKGKAKHIASIEKAYGCPTCCFMQHVNPLNTRTPTNNWQGPCVLGKVSRRIPNANFPTRDTDNFSLTKKKE